MRRYCELKLTDVLKEDSHKSSKEVLKTTVNRKSENMSTRSRLSDFPPRNTPLPSINSSFFMETRESRVSRKSTCSGPNTCSRNVDTNCRNLRKASNGGAEVIAEKRKRSGEKEKNIQDPPRKKIATEKISHIPLPSKVDKRIIEKNKKNKSRKSFWENKLTGARRVSKRLSNLKIKRQKSLKNLEESVSNILRDSKPSINSKARGKITPSKVAQKKATIKRKSYNKNCPEIHSNFGKLSHTKRLHPKISARRRPPTFTVTIKPQSSNQQSPSNEQFISKTCDEDSPVSKDVKIIKDDIIDEAKNQEVNLDDFDRNEGNRIVTINDQSKSKETDNESNTKESPEEFESLICNDEEFSDSSTIVIVDIESGENVEFDSAEEDKGVKGKNILEISHYERKITEEQPDDHSSGAEAVNETMVNNLQEEKSINENYSLITIFSETGSSEVLVNEGTSSSLAADSGIDLQQVVETIEIANVKGE